MGIKQIEQFSDIILRILQFLGKTQQLKTSKLAQNCGKTAVLHPSLLTESAGIMKSKLFPQCKQRIHPVLHIYYYSLTGWYWTPGDIHNPTRKVAALGVYGGEGGEGEPKNKQRIKRPKQNWAVRRPIVTKRSTANANTKKKHPASNVAAESAPHRRHAAKACDNNTQTIPNNMVLWQRLATCRRG